MIVLVLCKILCHYESLTPFKLMPKRRNHDFKGNTIVPMQSKDILTKNCVLPYAPVFQNTSKTHNDIKFGKEVKPVIVVDISLHSLSQNYNKPHDKVFSAYEYL